MTRGAKQWSDEFITELQGKYLPFRWRAPQTKELIDTNVQLSVRPIQLYEIVFPEEHKDIILNTILDDYDTVKSRFTQHKFHNKVIWAIRKALHIDPIPEYKRDIKFPVCKNNIEVVGIGVKKDYWIDKNDKQLHNPTPEQKKECFEGL